MATQTGWRGRRRRAPDGGRLPLAAVLAVLALAVAGGAALVAVSAGGRGASAPVQLPPARSEAVPQDGLALGDPDAPVTLDVYADFQCRHCATFARAVAPHLEAQEVAAGQARIVVHPFAFLGEESVRAAEAALCAADQGRFWDYHDALFANQQGVNAGAFSDGRLRQLAGALGLDTAAFGACLDGRVHRADVAAARRDGEARGVRATPTVFVDGRKLEGALPLAAYRQAIAEALAR